jgi:hypothetical protein
MPPIPPPTNNPKPVVTTIPSAQPVHAGPRPTFANRGQLVPKTKA